MMPLARIRRPSFLGAALVCGLAVVLCARPPAPAAAQTVSSNFAGFAKDSDEPLDIESDTLEVQDAQKVAIFRGNVKAVQGNMTLRSRELHVKYAGEQSAEGKGNEITDIRATGPVIITTDQEQTATSDWAHFDVKSQKVTIGGNVVLSQGENVIRGDRLVIDLTTGRSRFENEGERGQRKRVRGLFKPKKSDDEETPAPPAN